MLWEMTKNKNNKRDRDVKDDKNIKFENIITIESNKDLYEKNITELSYYNNSNDKIYAPTNYHRIENITNSNLKFIGKQFITFILYNEITYRIPKFIIIRIYNLISIPQLRIMFSFRKKILDTYEEQYIQVNKELIYITDKKIMLDSQLKRFRNKKKLASYEYTKIYNYLIANKSLIESTLIT